MPKEERKNRFATVYTLVLIIVVKSSLLHVVVIQVLSVAFPELLDKDPNYPYNQDLTTIIKTRV